MKSRQRLQILLASTLLLVSSGNLLLSQTKEESRKQDLPHYDQVLKLESSSETSANVEFGDLNGDGNLDVVLAKGRHWPLINRVLLGDGKGGFLESYDLGPESNRTYSSRLTDLDGDGDLDVVVSNDRPDQNLVYLNDGIGGFKIGSTFGNANWPTRNVNVADINGDGRPDIVVANRYGKSGGSNYICINNGNGKFESEDIPFSDYPATTISSADFNKDGMMDLSVPHRNGGQSYVFIQSKKKPLAFDKIPFGPKNATIRMSQACDLDNDGNMDIVTIDTRNGVIIYYQTGDGSFITSNRLGDPSINPYALYVADLNQDGSVDIIVGNVKSQSVVQFNHGDGKSFTPVTFGDGEGNVYGFAIGDLNKDGRLDIAAARSGATNVVYLAD
jgi:hypothetical protein